MACNRRTISLTISALFFLAMSLRESIQRTNRAELAFAKTFEIKVKSDHRSEFSNLSNWKEEAAMIILYFHLQLQFKYELFHILHITFEIVPGDVI